MLSEIIKEGANPLELESDMKEKISLFSWILCSPCEETERRWPFARQEKGPLHKLELEAASLRIVN
jgi:hypothetical protein